MVFSGIIFSSSNDSYDLWVGDLSTSIFPFGEDMLATRSKPRIVAKEPGKVEYLYLVTVAEEFNFFRPILFSAMPVQSCKYTAHKEPSVHFTT